MFCEMVVDVSGQMASSTGRPPSGGTADKNSGCRGMAVGTTILVDIFDEIKARVAKKRGATAGACQDSMTGR